MRSGTEDPLGSGVDERKSTISLRPSNRNAATPQVIVIMRVLESEPNHGLGYPDSIREMSLLSVLHCDTRGF